MPKTIHTPREELICGKLDLLLEAVIDNRKFNAIDLIEDIREDAQRMEQKLILRKQEARENES
jgi:hypothetical protein